MSDDQDLTEQKEQHRLGTINRWDPPEGDWAAEYDWTRYRGPKPWPVPGGWVFEDEEAGGYWHYYGEHGVGHHSDHGILDDLEDDDSVDDHFQALDDARGADAFLTIKTANPDEVSMLDYSDEEFEWSLKVDGTVVFRRVEPDRPDVMAAVAEALQAYHDGELEERAEEIAPTSGRKPGDVLEAERVEQRKAENQNLGDFA